MNRLNGVSKLDTKPMLNGTNDENGYDVVVIGAGCSGLECASKLYSYGFANIVVLEGNKLSPTFMWSFISL